MLLNRTDSTYIRSVPMATPGTLRAAPLRSVESLLAARGVDPAAILASAGLDAVHIREPDNRVSIRAVGELLRAAGEATRCEHFGLLVAEQTEIEALGLIGRAAAYAPSLAQALCLVANQFDLHDGAAVCELVTETGFARWEYALLDPDIVCADQILDAAMGIGVRVLRGLRGRPDRPLEVLLPRAHPANTLHHRRIFGTPVRFNSDRAAIVFPREWLDAPLAGSDNARYAAGIAELQRAIAPAAVPFAIRVQRCIRRQLCAGRASIAATAARLGMHRRTVDRHLKASGADFQGVKDAVRFNMARQLLRQTNLPVRAVAAALRFSDVSAFDHAFRRWTSMTPRAWRAQHAAPALVEEGPLRHHAVNGIA